MKAVESQQVSWWSVHELILPVLNQVNDWPLLGSPAWCSLARDDPRKWAAVLDGGQHHALRIELNQESRAEASKAVSGALDWAALSREILRRNDFYAAHPWLRRAVDQ
ncbi:hypothetical protein A5791_15835 [Mycobacterium sp. 852002-51163_SCH5372311]|uniref:DUF2742 domain-containing protein n=1 Tax=Mycobacterium sp. 852002-51163_SCH5372311 TaxID=1834097 RepID=UPI0007FEAE80|nr:DUF2742 domain-containing protein [Mycobacterium sp. 852002-51163_SCH5372311]OBF91066.1 hypothetical protein A5791_15835 [Mycobacterium sp. 852002-51163_SCH5372311]